MKSDNTQARAECLAAIKRFHLSEGRLPRNNEIPTTLGRRAGLPSRRQFDRAFGHQDANGNWIEGWKPAIAAYESSLVDSAGSADWDVEVGETMLRKELQARWGGAPYGGMEPSLKAQSIFLFTNPDVGLRYGYNFDGWNADGTFSYTGDGRIGDQTLRSGGNKALLEASDKGRTIRLFRSRKTNTTYIGVFELAEPPYQVADAPDENGDLRKVFVFQLKPVGPLATEGLDIPALASVPVELPVEANDTESYVSQNAGDPKTVIRREAALVHDYKDWLSAAGQETSRFKIPVPSGGLLYTDLYNKSTGELIEAKASAARAYVRAALGQLLDYARYVEHKRLGVLV